MSSIARHIASLKSKVIAKASKVQYQNHKVSTNTLTNGIIPCPRIKYNEIIYNDPNPKCCKVLPPLPGYIIYDGGDPYTSGNHILDGGILGRIYDGGNPSGSGSINYDGGKLPFEIIYDGGNITSVPLLIYDGNKGIYYYYDGGNITGTSPTIIFEGGSVKQGSVLDGNSIGFVNIVFDGNDGTNISFDGGNPFFVGPLIKDSPNINNNLKILSGSVFIQTRIFDGGSIN